VEVWWTYARRWVECHWAELVGELAGACCHAEQMGARDCKRCLTLFWRFDAVPTFDSFVARVKPRLPGHAQVHRAVVTNWTRNGWPEQ
jgi:hypothetical protein